MLAFLIFIATAITAFLAWRKKRSFDGPRRLMVVLGSGGHTGEMIYLMEKANLDRFEDVIVVHAACDTLSPLRFSQTFSLNPSLKSISISYIPIPRPIDVHDSYLRAFPKLVYSLCVAAWVLMKAPRVSHFFCNGPGVCIPPLLIIYFKRMLSRYPTKIIFIESFCRVESLSLSALIGQFFADELIVHWKKLHKKVSGSKFYGFLF